MTDRRFRVGWLVNLVNDGVWNLSDCWREREAVKVTSGRSSSKKLGIWKKNWGKMHTA